MGARYVIDSCDNTDAYGIERFLETGFHKRWLFLPHYIHHWNDHFQNRWNIHYKKYRMKRLVSIPVAIFLTSSLYSIKGLVLSPRSY